MKKILLIIILLTLFIEGAVPVKAISSSNKGTVPEDKPRYISLAPSTTEILFALGLDEEIVGVSTYCDYPLKAKNKEKVGEFSLVNIEKILSLKPDYIFCTGLEQAPIITELRRLNLKVYVADPKNIEELITSIKDIGKITHRADESEGLIKVIRSQIEEITSRVRLIPQEKKVKVFIEIWHDPLTTVGRGSFIDELLTLAGGTNIAYGTKRPYSIFSPEEVIGRNPDCIIIAYMEKEIPKRLMEKRFGWGEVSAVKNNRLYNDIDPALLLRPGPRVAYGVKEIYKRLYP